MMENFEKFWQGIWPVILLYKRLEACLQSPQSLICLLLDYLQTLKYEDSSLLEPDLFAFGPTVNLPPSNEPLEVTSNQYT